MKKSSPIMFNNEEQTVTQAGLFIHPITYDDFGRQPSDEEPHLDEPLDENIDLNNNFETEQVEIELNPTIETQTSLDEVDVVDDVPFADEEVPETFTQEDEKIFEAEAADEFDAEMQRKIEEMIESVMNSAKEEADWLRESRDDVAEPEVEYVDEPEVEYIDEPEVKVQHVYTSETKAINKTMQEPRIDEEVIEKVEVTQSEFPPTPPPRRRSATEEFAKSQASVESLPVIDESQMDTSEIVHSPQDIADEPDLPRDEIDDHSIASQLPSRLHLSSLEIDSLSVCSLQAGRIIASEIDSNTIVTNEFECKSSHNLGNPLSMEFPPGFIEEIVERVRSAERAEHQAEQLHQQIEQLHQQVAPQTETVPPPSTIQTSVESSPPQPAVDSEHAPVRPPLPVQFGFQEFTSAVPPSFYQLRDFSEEEAVHPQMPQQRRRRHQNKRRDSTSEEDYQRDQRSKNRSAPANDQSVLSLGGQFARACGSALRDSGGQLMEILRASSKDENKRDLHLALIILIVIVAGLILMSMGDKSVHHHHWDFFNPPDSHGR